MSDRPLLLRIESLLGTPTPLTEDRVVFHVTHPGTATDTSQLTYSLELYNAAQTGTDPPLGDLQLSASSGDGTLAAPLVFTVPAK